MEYSFKKFVHITLPTFKMEITKRFACLLPYRDLYIITAVWSVYFLKEPKDYKASICCFNTKHVALSSKSKRLIGWNKDNVLEWSDITSFVNLCSANKCVKFMWKQYMYSYSCIPNIENYPVITCWTMMIITHAIMHIHELLYCLVTYNLFSIFKIYARVVAH